MSEHRPEPTSDDVPVPSSGLLGFPADARVLIVNCDDFGMTQAINSGVIETIENGIGTSCSLMVVCHATAQAMNLLRGRPTIPFGIHLTMVCEETAHRWGPLSAKSAVPSLLDDTGRFFEPTPVGRAALLAQARLEEVEIEFRAQINAVADAGLTPTHLDFHCLADAGRDDILDLTVELAAEHGLAVRVWLEPGLQKARREKLPVVDNAFLDSFSLELDGKAARYARLLAELPTGLSEWAVHPSVGGAESAAIDGGWQVRRSDYDFLTSPRAGQLLHEHGITVIDYRPLQQAWTRNEAS